MPRGCALADWPDPELLLLCVIATRVEWKPSDEDHSKSSYRAAPASTAVLEIFKLTVIFQIHIEVTKPQV